ncbi:GCN5-related N-acetyltransferase, partial [Mycena vitilis]
ISASSLRILPIDVAQTVPLRHSVLWPDMPVSYVLLPEDTTGWHYGAFIDSNPDPVAVISLFVEACPIDNEGDRRAGNISPQKRSFRFRKFACDPAYQGFPCFSLSGQGIGTKLLRHVIAIVGAELDGNLLWCDARQATQSWYERRRMVAFGDIFLKGPVKYTRMKIAIDGSPMAAGNKTFQ